MHEERIGNRRHKPGHHLHFLRHVARHSEVQVDPADKLEIVLVAGETGRSERVSSFEVASHPSPLETEMII